MAISGFFQYINFKNRSINGEFMAIRVLKTCKLAFFWHFSAHKFEKSKFLARIHIKYFYQGIFVTLRVCLIRKYGSQNTAFFFGISVLLGVPCIPFGIFCLNSEHKSAGENSNKLVSLRDIHTKNKNLSF